MYNEAVVIIFTLLTFVSTFIGGLVGIGFKDKLHIILGFTAGVLLGVVFFDILPEISSLVRESGADFGQPMMALVVGFLLFHVLEKMLLIHHSHEEEYKEHKHPTVGVFSALALAGHSFMDGFGIGLGFQISSMTGILVAVAVISHDFSDGLNTVSLLLVNKNTVKKALFFLTIDALAPILGAVSTLFLVLPANFLLLYLGFFSGFLLYIGASDILPEAHSKNPSILTIGMTLLGVGFIYFISRFLQ